jgi:hypothetical protein
LRNTHLGAQTKDIKYYLICTQMSVSRTIL